MSGIKGYKGFNRALKCRLFQYEVGKTYHEYPVDVCKKGFHFCTFPLDVLTYYPFFIDNRYCEVVGSGSKEYGTDDSKVACSDLYVVKELGISGLVKAVEDYFLENVSIKETVGATDKYSSDRHYKIGFSKSSDCILENDNYGCTTIVTGTKSAAISKNQGGISINRGNRGLSSVEHQRSVAVSMHSKSLSLAKKDESFSINFGTHGASKTEGSVSVAITTGSESAALCAGDKSSALSSGTGSLSAVDGKWGTAVAAGSTGTAICKSSNSVCLSTGEYSEAISTEKHSMSINTGENGYAAADGYSSVAAALGNRGAAKGGVGCWIILAEHRFDKDGVLHIVDIQSARVDGEIVKADTWYKLVNGKIRAV